MKRSERIRERLQEMQDDIYARLPGGPRRMVGQAYRAKTKIDPLIKRKAEEGKRNLTKIVVTGLGHRPRKVVGGKR